MPLAKVLLLIGAEMAGKGSPGGRLIAVSWKTARNRERPGAGALGEEGTNEDQRTGTL